MVIKHYVEGYESFCEFIKQFDNKEELVHIYFKGSKLPSGASWCSDCVQAAPFIEKALEKAPSESHFIYVEVGDRATWADPNCSFRKDKRMNVMVLPTILRWKHPQKLIGVQCEKDDLLEMLFTEEIEEKTEVKQSKKISEVEKKRQK